MVSPAESAPDRYSEELRQPGLIKLSERAKIAVNEYKGGLDELKSVFVAISDTILNNYSLKSR